MERSEWALTRFVLDLSPRSGSNHAYAGSSGTLARQSDGRVGEVEGGRAEEVAEFPVAGKGNSSAGCV